MADNKDMEDLLNSMEDLEKLGDFDELGDLADEDFDTLLGEGSFSSEASSGNFNSEFDGLMDLTDFEELGSSNDMVGLDGLLDMESDQWASNGEKEKNYSEGVKENIPKKEAMETKETQKIAEIDSMLDSLDQSGTLTFSEEKRLKEKEMEQKDMGSNDLIESDDINQEMMMSNMNNVEQANDELRLDVPEDEKKEKKAFKEKKKADAKEVDKIGLWQKLFGNVPDENAEKDAKKEAERQALKEAKKAAKKTKEEIAQEKQEKKKAKEEADALKKASQAEKKAQKEEKKRLKKEEKEAAREQEEEPPTRINRVGAGIVLVTFAMIAIVIIVGNNSYAYSQCIAKATTYFSQREYTSAYNQIYGVKVKKSDEELKDQVMTVMFIEKQLNSFDNYFAMEMYPEALDSLLKGLDKYDKYLEQARSLGIESDVNYVKNKILSELKSAFNISEKGAYRLLSTSNAQEYTLQVIEAVNGR